MARPFKLFSTYDFFSVFLPGLATVFVFYMILPRDIQIGFIPSLIPVLALSFIFGQALHTLSAGIEEKLNCTRFVASHREQFKHYILKNENSHVVQKFKRSCIKMIDSDGDSIPLWIGIHQYNWDNLYSFVQSYIYNNDIGRSRTFQAIFAFSRSMAVLLFGTPLFYLLHYYLDYINIIISRQPKYLIFFPNFEDFIEAVWPLCWIGMIIFLYSSYTYKRYFVQYLVSDFASFDSGYKK